MMIEQFINFLTYEKRYSDHTIIAYQNDLKEFQSFITETYALNNLKEVEQTYIRSWIVTLLRDGKTNSTINRKIASIKSFYKFVQTTSSQTIGNPTNNLITPKKETHLPSFLKTSEMEQLLSSFGESENFTILRDKTIIELLYATGIRRSELMSLTISNFNFEQRHIKVLGKGNKERIIPIGKSVIANLNQYWQIRVAEYGTKEKHFFLTEKGKPLYPKAIYNIVKHFLEGFTTIKQKSPHILRHTFATHLLNNGAELNAIKDLLGHKSLASTQVYTHTTLNKLKKAYLKAHPKASNEILLN
jgi:integrase/recombinase XerC